MEARLDSIGLWSHADRTPMPRGSAGGGVNSMQDAEARSLMYIAVSDSILNSLCNPAKASAVDVWNFLASECGS